MPQARRSPLRRSRLRALPEQLPPPFGSIGEPSIPPGPSDQGGPADAQIWRSSSSGHESPSSRRRGRRLGCGWRCAWPRSALRRPSIDTSRRTQRVEHATRSTSPTPARPCCWVSRSRPPRERCKTPRPSADGYERSAARWSPSSWAAGLPSRSSRLSYRRYSACRWSSCSCESGQCRSAHPGSRLGHVTAQGAVAFAAWPRPSVDARRRVGRLRDHATGLTSSDPGRSGRTGSGASPRSVPCLSAPA